MILPINTINSKGCYSNQKLDNTFIRKNKNQCKPLDLFNYKYPPIFFMMGNISFKQKSLPVEITHAYNVKLDSKERLNLPNIHVHEFSESNLQVFMDVNENMGYNPIIEARLHINNRDNTSLIKNTLCKNIITNNLEKGKQNARFENNVKGHFTIVATSIGNKNFLSKLNKEIFDPIFTEEDLTTEKQKLIDIVKRQDFKTNNISFLLNPENFQTKEDCIKEIERIKLKDLIKYYDETVRKSDVSYYITLNKNIYNQKEINSLLEDANTNIDKEFQKKDNYIPNYKFALNKGAPIFIKKQDIKGCEFYYPYEENSLRDEIVANFTNLLIIFLTEPYHEINSDLYVDNIYINQKDSNFMNSYNKLKFDLKAPEFSNLTPQRALKIHKEIIKMVVDTDFRVTLNDIKNVYKENLNNELNEEYQAQKNNENLYKYGTEIFDLYEIIDSISVEDIKKHIEKYILNQEPVVVYSKEKGDL